MMDRGVVLREEFKDKLQFRVAYLKRFDAICQFMTTKLSIYNEVEMLRRQYEDLKETKENQVKKNQSMEQKIKANQLKKKDFINELDSLKSQEKEIIEHQERRVEHVKSLWKSYILAIDLYKSRLNCHIDLQEDFIIWTYKNISSESKKKYMVKFVNQDGRWTCTDIVPKLKSREALMETLKETNDIQGFLSNVRERFKKIANMKC